MNAKNKLLLTNYEHGNYPQQAQCIGDIQVK